MNSLPQMTDHEKKEFVSMMEREVGAWNDDLLKATASASKKPTKLKQEPLIEKCKEIYRQIRSKDSTARVPKCMEDELDPPYARATAKSMVKGQVAKLKLKKDGGEPTQSSANRKLTYENAKEKRIASSTKEELEAHRLNHNARNLAHHMKKKLSSQVSSDVDTPLSNESRMELLSNECLAVISSAAEKCDELNYILQQKGDTTLLKRMDLPPLSASKMAELSKKSFSIAVNTSAVHRKDEERFKFATTTNYTFGYIRLKEDSSEFQANKSAMNKKLYDVPTRAQASDLFGTQLTIQTSNDEYEPRSTEGTLHIILQNLAIGVPNEENDITRLWSEPNKGSKDAQGTHVCMVSIATDLGENPSIVSNLKLPKKSSEDEIARWQSIEKQRKDIKAKYSSSTAQQGPVLFIAAKVSKEALGKGATIVHTGNGIDKSVDIEAKIRTSVSSKTTLLVCGLQVKLGLDNLSSSERLASNMKIPVMDYLTYNGLVNGTNPVDGRKRLVSAGSGKCMVADAGVGSSLTVAKKSAKSKTSNSMKKSKAKSNSSSSSFIPKHMRKSAPSSTVGESTKSKPMSSSVVKGAKFKSSTSSSGEDTATSNIKKVTKPMPSSSAKRSSSSTVKSTTSASTMTSSGSKRKGSIKSNPRPTQAPRVSLDEQQVTSSAQAVSMSASAQVSSMSGQGATASSSQAPKKKIQVGLQSFLAKKK